MTSSNKTDDFNTLLLLLCKYGAIYKTILHLPPYAAICMGE